MLESVLLEAEKNGGKTMEDIPWELLQNWLPDENLTTQENINRLMEIFFSLQTEILSSCTGTEQARAAVYLDELTLDGMNRLFQESYQELYNFLEQYGRPGSWSEMEEGMFGQIAGRLPLADSGLSGGWTQTGRYGQQKLADGAGGDYKRQQGVIYHRDFQGVQRNADYERYVSRLERSTTQMGMKALEQARLQRMGQTGGTGGNRCCTVSDVRQADRFVQYLNHKFLGIRKADLPDTSEEYIGFWAGTLSLKTQVFLKQARIGEGMASALKYAVDAYIKEYFLKNSQALKETAAFRDRESCPSYQAEEIQKTYHAVIEQYKETKNPQESLLKGLQNAYHHFRSKQGAQEYQGISRYAADRGFFSRAAAGSLEEEMWNGWKRLCLDWSQFAEFMSLTVTNDLRLDRALDRNRYLATVMAYGKTQAGENGRRFPRLSYRVAAGIVAAGVGVGAVLLALNR